MIRGREPLELQTIRPIMVQESEVQESFESRRKRLRGWLGRNKKTVLTFALCAILLVCVLSFGFYQVNVNRYFLETLTSDDPHASGSLSGSPSAGSPTTRSPPNGALQEYFLSIGMRQDYLLQECQGTHYKLSFPDIDYALMGYNILRGYPLATGHDPGFTYPIFTADYGSVLQTAYKTTKQIVSQRV